ncbi:hypothetical protein AAF13_27435 (plasmid) [Escherichia coli O104:H4 str. C227-11]|nr:hypothetical protein [Escherichia coli]AKE87848.1 hypothetical protein AAF13_27435 [Escherichia coli O104:H4 str. C227-11]
MTTTEHPVRQLLWCALNALKTAQENHNITSEPDYGITCLNGFLVPADILSSVVSLAKSWR